MNGGVMKLSTLKNRMRKEADFASDVSKWIKDNPKLARGLGLGLGTALVGGLGAKLLGSDNAALWGLGLGAGAAGLDQYLSRNLDKVPGWLEKLYPEIDENRRKRYYNAFIKPGKEMESKVIQRANKKVDDIVRGKEDLGMWRNLPSNKIQRLLGINSATN